MADNRHQLNERQFGKPSSSSSDYVTSYTSLNMYNLIGTFSQTIPPAALTTWTSTDLFGNIKSGTTEFPQDQLTTWTSTNPWNYPVPVTTRRAAQTVPDIASSSDMLTATSSTADPSTMTSTPTRPTSDASAGSISSPTSTADSSSASASATPQQKSSSGGGGGLSHGALAAAIAVPVVVVSVALIAIAGFLLYRRRRRQGGAAGGAGPYQRNAGGPSPYAHDGAPRDSERAPQMVMARSANTSSSDAPQLMTALPSMPLESAFVGTPLGSSHNNNPFAGGSSGAASVGDLVNAPDSSHGAAVAPAAASKKPITRRPAPPRPDEVPKEPAAEDDVDDAASIDSTFSVGHAQVADAAQAKKQRASVVQLQGGGARSTRSGRSAGSGGSAGSLGMLPTRE